jgi:hypothetical protein
MDIFESLENLNVSEECFDEIIGIVEELINEDIKSYIVKKYGEPKFNKEDSRHYYWWSNGAGAGAADAGPIKTPRKNNNNTSSPFFFSSFAIVL